MPEYQVHFATSAAKEFRSLPIEIRERISLAVGALCTNPRPVGVRKLRGHERLYRIRVGQHRIVYEIDDTAMRIRVTVVRHRREAYR